MSAPLTVAFDPAAQQSGDIAQVIASLPLSLAHGGEGGELVGIDGRAGWPSEAERAIDGGARGVMIVRPVPADVTALIAKVGEQRVPVVIDSMWTHNPAVAISAAPFADIADDRCLLEARVYAPAGSDWHRILLDQLSLIRAAVSPVSSLDVIRRDDRGYSVAALLETGGRASITAVGTTSVPQSATLRIVQQQRVVELIVPDPATAVPGSVVVTTPAGANALPTSWETAHRAAWRRLHGLVQEGSATRDLEFFGRDQAMIAGW